MSDMSWTLTFEAMNSDGENTVYAKYGESKTNLRQITRVEKALMDMQLARLDETIAKLQKE